MLVCSVVGARPNFIKIAPIVRELQARNIAHLFVHTGQHYDKNMSEVFLQELHLPNPDIDLGVGSDTHVSQIARIMMALERVCVEHKPDLLVVPGDVNSSVAAAMSAVKLQIPVAHVEAGLRSLDRTMPEEINRIVIDHISDILFTTEESANQNLLREGIPQDRIYFVGNCMVDSLLYYLDDAVAHAPWRQFPGASPHAYVLVTLHRPSNVDDRATLVGLINTINAVSDLVPVIFPLHPRTRQRLSQWGIQTSRRVTTCEPLPYLTFLGLMAMACLVLTDSGGIQEETTALGVPCLTLRWNTERPVTTSVGRNRLVGTDHARIMKSVADVLDGKWPSGGRPPLWDGKASIRIVNAIEEWARSRRDSSAQTTRDASPNIE